MHTYALNNSLDYETIDGIVKNLIKNVTESDLNNTQESRVGNLARSLMAIQGSTRDRIPYQPSQEFIDFLTLAKGIFIKKHNNRLERQAQEKKETVVGAEGDEVDGLISESAEDGHIVSKENVAIREALKSMGVEFAEEKMLEDALFKTDFYIPQAKLAIEINGRSHYYPYSTRFNNFFNLKSKILRNKGYAILNLNSWKLEGMLRDPERAGLKDLMTKTIATYTQKQKELEGK